MPIGRHLLASEIRVRAMIVGDVPEVRVAEEVDDRDGHLTAVEFG